MELGTEVAKDRAPALREEIAILSSDHALLESLRAAVPELSFVAAGSVGELARLLGTHPCSVLGVDFAAVGAGGAELLTRLASLFHELPIVTIGAPADERIAGPLIERGIVFDSLVRPVSAARAHETLLGAAEHARERRNESMWTPEQTRARTAGMRPAAPPANAGPVGSRDVAGEAPVTGETPVASELPPMRVGSVGTSSAAAGAPKPSTRSTRWPLQLTLGVASLLVVGVTLYALMRSPAPDPRGATPAASPVASAGTTGAASGREGETSQVQTLVAAGDLALSRGALLEPIGASALDYYRQALALDADNAAARTGLGATAAALLRDAQAAFAARRYAEAETLARAAALADSRAAGVPTLLEKIRVARKVRGGARNSQVREGATGASAASNDALIANAGRPSGSPDFRSPAGASNVRAPDDSQDPRIASDAPGAGQGARVPSDAPAAVEGTRVPSDSSASGASARIPRDPPAAVQSARSPNDPAGARAASTPSDAQVASGAGAPAPGPLPARGASTSPQTAGSGPAAPLPPLRRVTGADPEYPELARSRGRSGYVDVAFTVDMMGRPRELRVRTADPPGVFDAAALRAVSTWRYEPPTSPRSVQVRLKFELAK